MVNRAIRLRNIDSSIEEIIRHASENKDNQYFEHWEISFFYRRVASLLKMRFVDYMKDDNDYEKLFIALWSLNTVSLPEDVVDDYMERNSYRIYHVLNGGEVTDIITGKEPPVPMEYVVCGVRRFKVPTDLIESLDFDDRDTYPAELHLYAGMHVHQLSPYYTGVDGMMSLGYNSNKVAAIPVDDFYRVWLMYDCHVLFGSDYLESLEEYTDDRRITEIHI